MRRFFIAVGFILFLFILWAFPQEEPEKSKEISIRLMTANLTSGNHPSYDLGHGTRIFQALRPDILLIQEFNIGQNSPQEIQAWVQSTFGAGFTYYRESDADIPNGIISRFPLLKQGEWNDTTVNNRDFAWVCIDLPGEKELWAVSVHFLTSGSHTRHQQALQLIGYIHAHVPKEHYLILGGDLNTQSRSETAIQTLSSVVENRGPYPTDQEGNENTNANRNKPYDWLLADSDLNVCSTPIRIDSIEFPHGLVFDSRRFQPLSAVPPVQFGDSNAPNMQHMAVIRDFLIPP